ncbi:MAG: hypothetical protein V2A76_16660 [Planctomycetota bacterium]
MTRSREFQAAGALAAGIVGRGVVHEFANLLTVLNGQRQMQQLGMSLDTRESGIPVVVHEPADRCQLLVEAFRHFFSDVGVAPCARPLTDDLDSLELLLRATLRGQTTTVECDPACAHLTLVGGTAHMVRLALLLAILSVLEHGRAGDRAPERVYLSARSSGMSCEAILATVTRFRPMPAADVAFVTARRLWDAATRLIRECGGTLLLREDPPGTVVLRLHTPA